VVEGLTQVYPDTPRPAIAALNMAIRNGEIFGLLGPNGAGKTTCISIMSTVLRPTQGRVVIDHTDAIRYPQRVRKKIGLVPQDIALYPRLTASETLHFFGRLYGLRNPLRKQRVTEALDLVGLSDHSSQRIHQYSGGMKRRLNLAAGILHRPQLLFLDEPTVGIDAQSRNLILERLKNIKNEGTTMVYTTHYMEEAALICDRIGIIDEGHIIALGRPTELVAQAKGCLNLEDLFLQLTGKHLRD
jgi:ABC-2 type transport system ATP-binding protein